MCQHPSKGFTCINLFDAHHNPWSWACSHLHFILGTKRLNTWLKIVSSLSQDVNIRRPAPEPMLWPVRHWWPWQRRSLSSWRRRKQTRRYVMLFSGLIKAVKKTKAGYGIQWQKEGYFRQRDQDSPLQEGEIRIKVWGEKGNQVTGRSGERVFQAAGTKPPWWEQAGGVWGTSRRHLKVWGRHEQWRAFEDFLRTSDFIAMVLWSLWRVSSRGITCFNFPFKKRSLWQYVKDRSFRRGVSGRHVRRLWEQPVWRKYRHCFISGL